MVAQWFDSNADILPEVQGWYDARGLGKLNADLFPPTGAVVPGVAVMFCYLTNSKRRMSRARHQIRQLVAPIVWLPYPIVLFVLARS